MARVVVVDGEPDVRRLIALVLRRAGHEVVEAARGDEALAVLWRERPDAAVLDAELPGPSGVELARALAADPKQGREQPPHGRGGGQDDCRASERPAPPEPLPLEPVSAVHDRGKADGAQPLRS